MKQFLVLLSLFLMGFITVQDSKTKIFIAGDSTAQTYNEERDGLIKGWGQMLDCYLNENIEVVNHAIGGRSTNSFIAEGRWDKLLSEVKPGDYVFIQFGHNDASTRPERHTSYEEYEVNLKRMVEDVREKDAHPVLLTSLVMRTFVNGHLTDNRLKGYPAITRKVAKEEEVSLIDVNLKSRDFITMLGDEASKPYYRWVEPGVDPKKPDGLQDDTHMMEKGAKKVAQFVAEGIAELKSGLSENITLIK